MSGGIGYAVVYHEEGVDGWDGPSGMWGVDIRAPLAPDEGMTWTRLFVWADLTYFDDEMPLALEADDTLGLPPPERAYLLELIAVPAEITGAPPVGTTWLLPETPGIEFQVTLPTYMTGNGLAGYEFAFSMTAAHPCDETACGDANCDGVVNELDIDAFIVALIGGQAAWEALVGGEPTCDFLCAVDADQSGYVDFFDIGPFVVCLSAQQP